MPSRNCRAMVPAITKTIHPPTNRNGVNVRRTKPPNPATRLRSVGTGSCCGTASSSDSGSGVPAAGDWVRDLRLRGVASGSFRTLRLRFRRGTSDDRFFPEDAWSVTPDLCCCLFGDSEPSDSVTKSASGSASRRSTRDFLREAVEVFFLAFGTDGGASCSSSGGSG